MGLGNWSLWGDEALYAAVAVDTAASGKVLPLEISGRTYLSKPIGGFLFLRAAFAALGPTEVAARLPAVLAGFATVMLVAHAAARWFGPAYGLLAGLLLVTSGRTLAFHGFRTGTFDALLVLMITLSLLLWIESRQRPSRSHWLGACGVVALSALVKNMAGPGLAAAAVLVGEWMSPCSGRRSGWRRFLHAATRGGALLLAGGIAFAVHLGVLSQLGVKRVVGQLVERDIVLRAQGDLHAGQDRDYAYYLRELGGDFGVVLLLLLPFAVGVVRRLRDPRTESGERLVWTAIASWSITTLVAVTLFRSKLPWYVLPSYPGFALALAAGLSELGRLRGRLRVRPALVVALGVTFGALQMVAGVAELQQEPVRTPLHDLEAVLDEMPAARFYVQPTLKWGGARETLRLRPQAYFYLQRLGERALRAWPPADAACAILYLERHGALDFRTVPERWRRFEFPQNLEKDAGRFLMLDGCGGRIARRLGGTFDQIPDLPLAELGRGRPLRGKPGDAVSQRARRRLLRAAAATPPGR